MSDKKMNEFPTAADGAFVYAEDANGNQIKISKADLASVVAGLICIESDITDANDFIYPFASVATSQIKSVAHLPVNGWGYLMVIRQAYKQLE